MEKYGKIRRGFNRLFFGYDIPDPVKDKEEAIVNASTMVAVDNDEAADLVNMSHFYSGGVETTQSLISQAALINEYRTMALHAEVDNAIDDIINEMVCADADEDSVVELKISDKKDIPDKLKVLMEDEFDNILRLLKFNVRSYDVCRQWYVDGRIYYHKIIDENNKKNGIIKLVNLDPRATKKVKEIKIETDDQSGVEKIVGTRSYFLYDSNWLQAGVSNDTGSVNSSINRHRVNQAIEISEDSIAYTHSGILGGIENNFVFSFLEKARKPLNNLRMLEDAVVIYRITRAPERKAFYVGTGNLQPKAADQYITSLMNKYRTRLVYDSVSGKVKSNAHQVSIMEDYWLPRMDGDNGTKIETLEGGDNLGKIEDLLFFQKKLYKSLCVPPSRLENEATISIGNRMAEITRDEWKFNKFIQRLRRRFNELFNDLLKTQLVLKNIITADEWEKTYKDIVSYEYKSDSFIREQQDAEILEGRLAQIESIDPFVGKWFTREEVLKGVLRKTDEEIKQFDKQVKKEVSSGLYMDHMEKTQYDMGIHPDQLEYKSSE